MRSNEWMELILLLAAVAPSCTDMKRMPLMNLSGNADQAKPLGLKEEDAKTMLERFGHGGDWHTAADLFGEREQWLDFSANMNPPGPPPHVQHEALRSAWQTITRYPDPA